MKKYILTFIALTTLWSCQTDEQYQDLNKDPKNPTAVASDFLFTAATVSLADQMASPNVNLNVFRFLAQYLTETTYTDEVNYDLIGRNIPQNHWSEIYRDVIFDIQDAKSIVMNNPDLDQSEKDARLGQLEVVEVYAWHVLVDTFGDVPYTQAVNSEEYPLPAYDDAATIYQDLITRLDNVNAKLSAGQGYSSADVIFGGDMNQWMLFANSLRLRLAMRIADVNPELSKSTAEAAVQDGVFSSLDESATIAYEGNSPNTNPLWEDLVQSGRNDYLITNTIVDIMKPIDDPRMSAYFTDNKAEYTGAPYGDNNSYTSYTHIGQAFLDPTHPGIFLDYPEVEFYLAEAAQRGYNVGGTAGEHYNTAVTASIEYWGGTEAEANAYLSQPEVAYDAANWRKSIGTQFWIAMFDDPFEGWSVWRKFDAPKLNLPAIEQLPVPLRYTYPINEQNLNEANYNAASDAIGGDDQQTPLFWDVQ
ncbi:MAG: SusD/RagB family nutrient-binding outer membrane lipoprotein [Salegentibacter sp.]